MVKGIKWMLWGLFLKLVLADCYFLFVHAVDGSWQRHNGFTLLVSSLCYMVQLYGDFAGYSLMAIGSAALMGIELPQNFMRPFFSVGVRDFWRRWHISLSTWLRDYIYFPLGGSRCTEWRTRLNLLITFMVSGLWHGAGWIFVLWGMLHGLWVALERAIHFRDYSEKTWVKVVVMPITFVIAALLFVTFNHDWGTTMYFYQAIFTDLWPMKLSMTLSTTLQARLLSMAAALAIVLMKEAQEEWWPHVFAGKKWGTAASASFYVAVVWMILAMGVLDSGSQFIYMHF
ncbi:MAG: MBOAT family protein [Muribaculaceae bacterium]|nr:MBOAT family protein [Muribaculaceae bacterium]